MRTLRRTTEFDEFYNSVAPKVQEKIDYALTLISQIKVVSTKFVKNEVLLLNGFMKKSTKDYKAQIKIAEKIINELAK